MSETSERDNRETRRAVCFERRDYAGPGRRIVIVCVDFVTVILLSFAALAAIAYVAYVRHPESDLPQRLLLIPPVVGYLYLVVLKRSRVRTLGYIVTGVRIVDIEGRRPSLLQMTTRLWPLLPVPWSFLFDLGWIMDEPRRQTLRDKWAGTFVVRRKAEPVGTASVRYKRIGFAGLFLIFPEIGRVEKNEKTT